MSVASRAAVAFRSIRIGHAAFAIAVTGILLGAGLYTLATSGVPGGLSRGLQNRIDRVVVEDDGDNDGLPDHLEARIGSRSSARSTLGRDVPDGWVYQFLGPAVDWNDTGLLNQPVLVPPPSALPEALRAAGAFPMPNASALFLLESQWRDPDADQDPWWLARPGLDPRKWDNDLDGIADAWLVWLGLDPLTVDPDGPAPGDPAMTLREKYEAALDPTRADTDGDGLEDAEERAGAAELRRLARAFKPTDPRRFATRGDGIADGFLVAFGLDPTDPEIGAASPARDGVTVLEKYVWSVERCERRSAPAGCDLRALIEGRQILDPTRWDSNEDRVPDAWALRDRSGLADPLQDLRTVIVADSGSWDAIRWTPTASAPQGLVVDEENPVPAAAHKVSLAGLYAFNRPRDWDESTQGPWWGGLSPSLATPASGLPVAVALRGWNLTVNQGLGRDPGAPAPAAELVRLRAAADPRDNDTDEDGLSDRSEYFGLVSGSTRFRTDPSDPDTDGDRLPDGREPQFGTNPLRRDSSGDYLSDGEAVQYWTARHRALVDAVAADPTAAAEAYRWLGGADGLSPDEIQRLSPLGVLDGPAPNVLNPDADGDGLKNGAELFPNRFLDRPSAYVRPATDPARVDTDGDRLPDMWEIGWSLDRFYNCPTPCESPVKIEGWPLDPSRRLSVAQPGAESDWDVSLSGDDVRFASDKKPRRGTNGLAYMYDLHPHSRDTNQDGIPNLFAIHWGVGLPDGGVPLALVEEAIQQRPAELAWVGQQADRLGALLARTGLSLPPLGIVVIDPRASEQTIAPASNLLATFSGREKGTWRPAQPGESCQATSLPAGGPRREAGYRLQGAIPGRVGLVACWVWSPYPLSSDIARRTNPWSHDFDGNALPDAWEEVYGLRDIQAATTTPASREAGCEDPALHAGLPPLSTLNRTSYCLNFLDAYARGLGPDVTDADHGGLSDWLEVALGLNPLDAGDDLGGEDWDGDGLLNRMEDELGTSRLAADTDRDGLLDGDPMGLESRPFLDPAHGDGNLCVRPGTTLVPGTAGRPATRQRAAGALNFTVLHQMLVAEGMLHDVGDDLPCPAGATMFRREGTLDRWFAPQPLLKGTTPGTASLEWDTGANGIPDGWLAYWQRRATTDQQRLALNPAAKVAGLDPDNDFLSTLAEYRSDRPADWSEPRDGPWWGGLDPASHDSDRDGAWYRVAFAVEDALDPDNDNDGLIDAEDPFPGLDQANAGIAAWSASDLRYAVRYDAVWPALALRRHSHGLDARDVGSQDGVPDAFDRARVRVVASLAPDANITKDGSPFSVEGGVWTTEQPTGAGHANRVPPGTPAAPGLDTPVQNATVRILVSDGQREALAGVAFTDAEGQFHAQARIRPDLLVTSPFPAVVAGRLLPVGASATIATGAEALSAGPITVRAVVDANDPKLQGVRFDGQPSVLAYKESPFEVPLPTDLEPVDLEALTVNAGQPSRQDPRIVHAAEAIFRAASDPIESVLRAETSLVVTLGSPRTPAGNATRAFGQFVDALGAGLGGREVSLAILQGTALRLSAQATTAPDGSFDALLPTQLLVPGAYRVVATALLGAGDGSLLPPPAAEAAFSVAVDSRFIPEFHVGSGGPFSGGEEAPLVAEDPTMVRGRLVDHRGQPVANNPVSVRVTSLSAGQLWAGLSSTDAAGRFALEIGPLPPTAPLETAKLSFAAAPITSSDVPGRADLFLRPSFGTLIEASPALLEAGKPGAIQGVLRRLDGAAVALPAASIVATGPGGLWVNVNGTGPEGLFTVPLPLAAPGNQTWSLRFRGVPGGFLRDSAAVPTWALHVGATRLQAAPTEGLRARPVVVQGSVTTGEGSAVSGGPVRASWSDDPYHAVPAEWDGARWAATLPGRQHAGEAVARVDFLGLPHLRPTSLDVPVRIRIPTALHAVVTNLTVDATGQGAGAPVQVRLENDLAAAMPGRRLQAVVEGPDGATTSRVLVTDAQGRAILEPGETPFDLPGVWRVSLRYAGNDVDLPSVAAADFTVTHSLRLRVLGGTEQARVGEPLRIVGESLTALRAGLAFSLRVRGPGGPLAEGPAATGTAWSVRAPLPPQAPGMLLLHIDAVAPPFVVVEAAMHAVHVRVGAHVELEERRKADGSRDVGITLEALSGAAPPGRVEVILGRFGADGVLSATYRVPLAAGAGNLSLAPQESGELRVLSLADPSVSLESASALAIEIPFDVVPVRTPKPWTTVVAVVMGGLAFLAAVAYVAWRRLEVGRPQRLFRRALARLEDPRVSTVAAIEGAYEGLLTCLRAVGFQAGAHMTAREVTESARAHFGWPPLETEILRQLFERTVYTRLPPRREDRAAAVRSFRLLAGQALAAREDRA